jgi:uroporphyrinogen-III synthase
VGLATDLAAAAPTTQGVIETLGKLSLAGRRVGVQLYGTEPNPPLMRFLAAAGAQPKTVSPYIYAPASDEEKVLSLIKKLAAGQVDAIAFTSASQVDRLFDVAKTQNAEATLKEGLTRTKVAAIGPVVLGVLQSRGVTVDIVPEQPFIMKRLSAAIAKALIK